MHEDQPYIKRSSQDRPAASPRTPRLTRGPSAPVVRRPGFSRSYDGYRAKVASMLDEGAALMTIERTVDAYALDSERKAALWLLAHATDNQTARPRGGRAAISTERIGRVVRGTGPGVRA